MEKNNEPAFPRQATEGWNQYGPLAAMRPWAPQTGLTKREYAAIHIMAGYSANASDTMVPNTKERAEWAVQEADALLAALTK